MQCFQASYVINYGVARAENSLASGYRAVRGGQRADEGQTQRHVPERGHHMGCARVGVAQSAGWWSGWDCRAPVKKSSKGGRERERRVSLCGCDVYTGEETDRSRRESAEKV